MILSHRIAAVSILVVTLLARLFEAGFMFELEGHELRVNTFSRRWHRQMVIRANCDRCCPAFIYPIIGVYDLDAHSFVPETQLGQRVDSFSEIRVDDDQVRIFSRGDDPEEARLRAKISVTGQPLFNGSHILFVMEDGRLDALIDLSVLGLSNAKVTLSRESTETEFNCTQGRVVVSTPTEAAVWREITVNDTNIALGRGGLQSTAIPGPLVMVNSSQFAMTDSMLTMEVPHATMTTIRIDPPAIRIEIAPVNVSLTLAGTVSRVSMKASVITLEIEGSQDLQIPLDVSHNVSINSSYVSLPLDGGRGNSWLLVPAGHLPLFEDILRELFQLSTADIQQLYRTELPAGVEESVSPITAETASGSTDATATLEVWLTPNTIEPEAITATAMSRSRSKASTGAVTDAALTPLEEGPVSVSPPADMESGSKGTTLSLGEVSVSTSDHQSSADSPLTPAHGDSRSVSYSISSVTASSASQVIRGRTTPTLDIKPYTSAKPLTASQVTKATREEDDEKFWKGGVKPKPEASQDARVPLLIGKDDTAGRRLSVQAAYISLITVAACILAAGAAMFVWNRCYFRGQSYIL